jgi:hypothetical protein
VQLHPSNLGEETMQAYQSWPQQFELVHDLRVLILKLRWMGLTQPGPALEQALLTLLGAEPNSLSEETKNSNRPKGGSND